MTALRAIVAVAITALVVMPSVTTWRIAKRLWDARSNR